MASIMDRLMRLKEAVDELWMLKELLMIIEYCEYSLHHLKKDITNLKKTQERLREMIRHKYKEDKL
ncbi:hypothetical protein ACJMK2_015409 [Sinanodonta woodiana]|uniref:Uncharacterized protein n=1 Tax=Sinanodonta woodiana TaxID=1069815 RepID=A0ABD3URA6_SINWO